MAWPRSFHEEAIHNAGRAHNVCHCFSGNAAIKRSLISRSAVRPTLNLINNDAINHFKLDALRKFCA